MISHHSGLSFAASSLLCHRQFYSLEIVASDRAHNPTNTSTRYNITIEDVNDNAPMFFLPVERSFSVNEEEPVGYRLTTVAANDSDSGLNGQVHRRSTLDSLSTCILSSLSLGFFPLRPHILDSVLSIQSTIKIVLQL